MDVEVRRRPPSAEVSGRSGEAGFSLVEALVAAAILMMIALGLLPMFAKSIMNNAAGSDHTVASVFAKDEIENLGDAAFGVDALDIDDAAFVRQTADFWLPGTMDVGDESWVTALPAGSRPRWTRTTTVSQYSISAFDDDDWVLGDIERKAGNTQAIEVHLKVIEVRLDSGKRTESGLPPGPSLVYRIIKPF